MSGQIGYVPLDVAHATRDSSAPATGGRGDEKARAGDALQPSLSGDDDMQADQSLEGIPREVIESIGLYETDCAGGCG